MTLRVISWPMGFIIVAKGIQNLLIFSELAWTVVYLGLAWLCVDTFNLKGAGIAFFLSYLFHVFMINVIVWRLSGFRWSSANLQSSFLFVTLLAVIFCSYYTLPPLWAMGVGTLAVLLSGIYSIQVLLNLISLDRIPRSVLKLLQWLHLSSPEPYKNNDLESTIKTKTGDIVVENKPLTSIERLIFTLMICTMFSMWAYWYEGVYGWRTELGFFIAGNNS
jgi:PST family polysaccharide transporter